MEIIYSLFFLYLVLWASPGSSLPFVLVLHVFLMFNYIFPHQQPCSISPSYTHQPTAGWCFLWTSSGVPPTFNIFLTFCSVVLDLRQHFYQWQRAYTVILFFFFLCLAVCSIKLLISRVGSSGSGSGSVTKKTVFMSRCLHHGHPYPLIFASDGKRRRCHPFSSTSAGNSWLLLSTTLFSLLSALSLPLFPLCSVLHQKKVI